jgi:TolB-like protein/YesN/AraC family two-component response regulator
LENQFFADGISEEIISALSKIQGLKVTARTSSFRYRNTNLDIRHIGNELGVSTVLEGSVRKSDNRIRISAQLIRTDTGFQIWSERFDRELTDIFDLQDEVSLIIADKIRENFGHLSFEDRLVTTRTEKSSAYESYLKGRYYQLQWTEESIKRAQEAYKESIAADPTYPMPYLGMSQCFTHLAAFHNHDRLKSLYMAYYFIEQLGEEHEYLAEFHYTKGIYHQIGNWEYEKALGHLSRALSINPNYSEALEAKADLLIAIGSFDEAKSCIEKAVEINPNAINHHFIHALLHYYKKDFEGAINRLEKALTIDSDWQMALQLKVLSALQSGQHEIFNRTMQKLSPGSSPAFKALGKAFAQMPIDEEIPRDAEYYFPVKAAVYVRLGEHEKALEILKEAIAGRSGQYIGFAFEPLLAPLYEFEEFKKYVAHFHANVSPHSDADIQEKEESVFSQEETAHYLSLLADLMQEEKAFLDPKLSLRHLAELLNIHPNKLSWLINHEIGKGFNDYVNHFRLKEFQRLALNEDYKHLTLLGLAFESGFNSKSVFNDYFKKSVGTTPKKWISSAK